MIRVTTEITPSQPGKTVNPNFLDEAGLFLDNANQSPDRAQRAAPTLAGIFLDSRCSQPGNLAVHEYAAKEYQTAQRLQFWSPIPQRQRSAVRRS